MEKTMRKKQFRSLPVLIVDDEKSIRDLTAQALTKNTFSCDTATDGREALDKFREKLHDVVITDLRMPKMHGHSLLMELLKQSNPPHLVVLTGVATPTLVKDLIGRGVDDIVAKPVDLDLFAAKLQSVMKRKRPASDSSSQAVGNGCQAHAQTEEALDIFTLCIPPALNHVLTMGDDSIDDLPEMTKEFIRRLVNKHTLVDDRRDSNRVSMFSTAVAIAVNKEFIPQGEAAKVTLSNLSTSGACIMHTRAISDEYLALRWNSVVSPSNSIQAVMRVTRCKPLGPFYEVAGQFVVHD